MKLKAQIFYCLIVLATTANAQFAPAAGLPGSTAISKDDTRFAEWATGCSVQRGYMDIAQPDSGYASVGNSNAALGKAGENGVVSLGDGGTATLTFFNPIYNGDGYDFAVFENGFATNDSLAFLEFAFVEVSSDGANFFRFPTTTHIQDSVQVNLQPLDCSLVNNLAGKYVFGYGTPFDLEDLKNVVGLDVNHVTHVRVADVVGSINDAYATHDQFGKKINDPYPTLFPSSGFDLDAVGVINQVNISSIEEFNIQNPAFNIFPNPSSVDNLLLTVSSDLIGKKLIVFDVAGRIVNEEVLQSQSTTINTKPFAKGIYFFSIANGTTKLIIK